MGNLSLPAWALMAHTTGARTGPRLRPSSLHPLSTRTLLLQITSPLCCPGEHSPHQSSGQPMASKPVLPPDAPRGIPGFCRNASWETTGLSGPSWGSLLVCCLGLGLPRFCSCPSYYAHLTHSLPSVHKYQLRTLPQPGLAA